MSSVEITQSLDCFLFTYGRQEMKVEECTGFDFVSR